MSIEEDEELQLQLWKTKKTIKFLEEAQGLGTSLITLIISPGDQISKTAQLLTTEYGTATNIKSRVNRQSVQTAIVSVQQKLKLYNKIPDTGLCIFCGLIDTDKGQKMVNIDFIPHKTLGTSIYLCHSKFNVEPLKVLLQDDHKYGFVIIDGEGCLFGLISGSNKEILYKFSVDLPKKHHKGGQSAQRFGRIRLEKRDNYIRKVTEIMVQNFITNNMPNINGLILAGPAEFKVMLSKSPLLDPQLKSKIINIVDVSYGNENGFNQAIELSQDLLKNVKLLYEKKILVDFFSHISQNTNKVCFGIKDTINALESGSIETIIIYEHIDLYRYVKKDKSIVFDKEKNDIEYLSKEHILDWFSKNKDNKKGSKLHIISDKSQEGSQFILGFGGFGGILRWSIDFNNDNISIESYDNFDDDF